MRDVRNSCFQCVVRLPCKFIDKHFIVEFIEEIYKQNTNNIETLIHKRRHYQPILLR